ncbi:unnamed protein product [Phytophthora fragariaefolia]|uniref:Unnamed protein product n=1 Tax=Phytophthora fragariaefolia TaxID=1490495 RepID=A0A9W6XBW5_9STRA|nr:unnamed protein product [Phytophthora fragariaefolia]
MAKGTSSPSGLSPATAGGFPPARINSANSVDSTDSVTMAALDATVDKARSIQFDDEATRGHGDGKDDEGEDEEEKAEFGDVKTTAELLGKVEELSPKVSQIGRPLPVRRNLAAELEDDADDDDDDENYRGPSVPDTQSDTERSANRMLARLGEEMRSESEWMMMFAHVAMTQAKWPVLGPELTQPVNSTDINQLVGDTVLLLKAMGFRYNGRPNSLILGDWSLSRPGAELLKWKRRLSSSAEDTRNEERQERSVPSNKRTPYYEDSHIQTPKTLKGRSARYAEFYDAADEAKLSGDDSGKGRNYRDSAKDLAKDAIRRLSLDGAESDRGHYFEVRSHASLDKIAEFEGKRYRSDDSPKWLKRFIYEMMGTRIPQDSCGGADASDHVEYFLLDCGDEDIMDLLYPMRLDDIERVEKIINTKILGEKRKRQRDRLSESRNRDIRRVESQRRFESTRLTKSRRSERRDDRRDDRRDYRRDDRRTRRDDGRDRRVTVAATADEEEEDGMECQPSRRLSQHDYDDDESDYSRGDYSDSEGGSDHDYIDAGLADEKNCGRDARKVWTRTQWSSARPQGSSTVQGNSANQPADTVSRANRFTDRRDTYGRRSNSRERPQYGPCPACGGQRRPPGPLHAEQFKPDGPPTLTGLDEAGLPQSAEPVAEMKYILAYVGKAGRPERVWKDGNDGSKWDGIDGELVYSKEESRVMISNADAARLRKGGMGMAKTIKLLPGERLEWWSAQKFDSRVRRTRCANGRARDRQGQSWDTRAWVKITLGWEVSYELEVWVMDHHAGVDLILGTDFMIPAGIRLDLYNSLAKLPDEVVVPLIKSLNSADNPKGGLQSTDGPTETICLPGRVSAEFRVRRRQPAESTHELWVRRTRNWIPTVVLNKHGKVARALLTSTKSSMTWCPAHFSVLNWAPHEILPPEGFVRVSSAKYRDWQVLFYETAIDKGLLRKERQLYDEWMERQPPAVERRAYSPPTKIARRQSGKTGNADGENCGQTVNLASGPEAVTLLETSDGLDGPVVSLTRDEDGSCRVLASAVNSAESEEGNLVAPRVENRGNPPDRGRQTGEINGSDDMLDVDPEKNLHLRYLLTAELDNDERGEGEPRRHDNVYERVPNSLVLEDYAHEPAFLPDLTDVVSTRLDYSADNVVCSTHSAEQISRLVEMHRSREWTMVSITPVVELDETLKQLSPLSQSSARVWIDPQLLYAAVPPGYHDHVLSFHGSVTTTRNGGFDSCSWIIWRLPSWDIEIAASAHLPSTTVNIAEYTGMNNDAVAALQRGVSNLIIVGDPRLAIQQYMGVTVCKKGVLQVEFPKHKELTKNLNSIRYLHVVRLYNSAADSMATEALEAKAGWVVLTLERKAELKALNKIPEVLYVSGNSADTSRNSADVPEEPKVTGATHGRARRVHVGNEERENPVSEAIVEHLEELFKGPSRPPTRQSTTRNEAEFRRSQPRALEGIAQLPAEFTTLVHTWLRKPSPVRIADHARTKRTSRMSGSLEQYPSRSSRNDGKTNTESTKTRDISILTAQLLEAGGTINSAVARTEQVGVLCKAHDEGPMLRSQMRGFPVVADGLGPRTNSAVTKSTAELKLGWNKAEGSAGSQLHLNDGPRIQAIHVMDEAEDTLRSKYEPDGEIQLGYQVGEGAELCQPPSYADSPSRNSPTGRGMCSPEFVFGSTGITNLNFVRSIHVARQYNSAAHAMVMEALDNMTGRVVLSGKRKTELKLLNRIPETLKTEDAQNRVSNTEFGHSRVYKPGQDSTKVGNSADEPKMMDDLPARPEPIAGVPVSGNQASNRPAKPAGAQSRVCNTRFSYSGVHKPDQASTKVGNSAEAVPLMVSSRADVPEKNETSSGIFAVVGELWGILLPQSRVHRLGAWSSRSHQVCVDDGSTEQVTNCLSMVIKAAPMVTDFTHSTKEDKPIDNPKDAQEEKSSWSTLETYTQNESDQEAQRQVHDIEKTVTTRLGHSANNPWTKLDESHRLRIDADKSTSHAAVYDQVQKKIMEFKGIHSQAEFLKSAMDEIKLAEDTQRSDKLADTSAIYEALGSGKGANRCPKNIRTNRAEFPKSTTSAHSFGKSLHGLDYAAVGTRDACGIALSGFRPRLRTLAGSVMLANRDQECTQDTDPGVSIMSGSFGYFRI